MTISDKQQQEEKTQNKGEKRKAKRNMEKNGVIHLHLSVIFIINFSRQYIMHANIHTYAYVYEAVCVWICVCKKSAFLKVFVILRSHRRQSAAAF